MKKNLSSRTFWVLAVLIFISTPGLCLARGCIPDSQAYGECVDAVVEECGARPDICERDWDRAIKSCAVDHLCEDPDLMLYLH